MSEGDDDHPGQHRRIASARDGWIRLQGRHGSATAALWLVLLALGCGILVFLLAATKPWDAGIAERVAEGKSFRVQDYVAVYSWWAALFNGTVVAGLLATVCWWGVRPAPATRGCGVWAPAGGMSTSGRCWFWVAVLGAVVAAAALRAPRLGHSLWNDEEYSLRRYTWGEYRLTPGGGLEFDPVPWRDAVFKNTNGNNHVWHTLEARTAHALRSLVAGGGSGGLPRFSERAARAAPFASGLAAVVVIACLGALAGAPRAGAAAAWLLALNPWHLRYAVEARGYSTLILALLVMLVCGIRAIETGRWRWWFGAAAAQVIALLCFLGSVYVVVAFNAAVGTGLLTLREDPATRRVAVGRWFVSSAMAACVALQVLLPSVPQILGYLGREDHQSGIEMGARWLRELWSFLVIGFPWNHSPGSGAPDRGTGLTDLAGDNPAVWWFAVAVLPAAAGAGLVSMMRSGWRARLVCTSLLLGAAAAYLHNWMAGSKMYLWYLLYLVPALALAAAWGIAAATRRWERHAWVPATGLAAFIGLTAWVVSPSLVRLARFDRQPMKQVVTATRGASPALEASDNGVLTATFGVSDRQVLSYDPRAEIVREQAALEALIAQAREEGKALYVYFCGRRETSERYPDTVAAVTGSGRFERTADLPGLEAFFTYEVWRLKR